MRRKDKQQQQESGDVTRKTLRKDHVGNNKVDKNQYQKEFTGNRRTAMIESTIGIKKRKMTSSNKHNRNIRYGSNHNDKSSNTYDDENEDDDYLKRFAGSSDEEDNEVIVNNTNIDEKDDDDDDDNDEQENRELDHPIKKTSIQDEIQQHPKYTMVQEEDDEADADHEMSSDDNEDDDHDDDDDDSDNNENTKQDKSNDKKEMDSDNDDEFFATNDDDNDDDAPIVATGMANAMFSILGGDLDTKKSKQKTLMTKPVVLSKTITKIQKELVKEKTFEKELKDKRKINHDKNVAALHIPLSVATSSSFMNNSSITAELETERTHRRVATRGIVALFNAISTHQNNQQQQQGGETNDHTSSNNSSNNKTTSVKKLTKDSFLDMIKSTAAKATVPTATEIHRKGSLKHFVTTIANTDNPTEHDDEKDDDDDDFDNNNPSSLLTKNNQTNQQQSGGRNKNEKWNALQDDYMLNPKKNWDEDDDDDDDDDNEDQE